MFADPLAKPKRSILLMILATVAALALAGCGSGGGGSHSSPPSPPNPPSPPTDTIQAYDGAVGTHIGLFASQGATSAEYHVEQGRLVFSTVLGTITLVSPATHVWISGKEYAVTFAPASHLLIIVDVLTSNDGATWTLTLITSPG